jgi:tetratricopeptide (TPR) repeat protein
MSVRSDVEILARTRVLLFSLLIYLLAMVFLELGDRIYGGTEYVTYSRLATIPFFLLLVRRWQRLVRVRPPAILAEARQLETLERHRAARERYEQVRQLGDETHRVDRARRILQDGLAIPVAAEAQLEMGRCSTSLGEIERAARELRQAHQLVPARAEIAIELAECLDRIGHADEAAQVLISALPYMDASDRATLEQSPALQRLLGDHQPPRRSVFWRKLVLERLAVAVLVVLAIAHGLHLYLGLF